MGLEVTMMGVRGGVALGWVFAVGGSVRVRVHRDSQGVMWCKREKEITRARV